MRSNVQFIRDILYNLKRDYGVSLRYGRILRQETNPNTGRNTTEKLVITVRKAIPLSGTTLRKFVQDIAYLAANKNFTYGALFDETMRVFIIDARELPNGFQLLMDDYILMDKNRYYIKKAEILEHGCGWLLFCVDHEGANPFDVVPQSVTSSLEFSSEVANDDS